MYLQIIIILHDQIRENSESERKWPARLLYNALRMRESVRSSPLNFYFWKRSTRERNITLYSEKCGSGRTGMNPPRKRRETVIFRMKCNNLLKVPTNWREGWKPEQPHNCLDFEGAEPERRNPSSLVLGPEGRASIPFRTRSSLHLKIWVRYNHQGCPGWRNLVFSGSKIGFK